MHPLSIVVIGLGQRVPLTPVGRYLLDNSDPESMHLKLTACNLQDTDLFVKGVEPQVHGAGQGEGDPDRQG